MNWYSLYHLTVASTLALPEAVRQAHRASLDEADVEISSAPHQARREPKPWFEVVGARHARIYLADKATIEVKDGQRIVVRKDSAFDEALVRVYLLGSAMGCALHQRGVLPLHVSAVEINGQAWAFTAPSGTGKSTLAARLHGLAGCGLVSDDVAALDFFDGQAHVAGGPPLLKLQPDVAALLTQATTRPGPRPDNDKLSVHPTAGFIQGWVPLAGIIVLERDDTLAAGSLAIEPLRGADAFVGAREAVYRFELGWAMRSPAGMFQTLTELTRRIPLYRGQLGRWSAADGPTGAMAIVERLATLAQSSQVLR